MGKSTINVVFSIALLNYQRVTIKQLTVYLTKKNIPKPCNTWNLCQNCIELLHWFTTKSCNIGDLYWGNPWWYWGPPILGKPSKRDLGVEYGWVIKRFAARPHFSPATRFLARHRTRWQQSRSPLGCNEPRAHCSGLMGLQPVISMGF